MNCVPARCTHVFLMLKETCSAFTAALLGITQICSFSMMCSKRLIKDHIYLFPMQNQAILKIHRWHGTLRGFLLGLLSFFFTYFKIDTFHKRSKWVLNYFLLDYTLSALIVKVDLIARIAKRKKKSFKKHCKHLTYIWGNFKLFDNSQLKEHADASLDEAVLCHREVAEGEQVQALSIHVVSYWAVCSLHNTM